MKKFLKAFLALGLTAALLSTSVYGEEILDEEVSENASHNSGDAIGKNFETGEISYIPTPEMNTFSNATEGTTQGYDPYKDFEEADDFFQTYMTDNRIVIPNPADKTHYRKMVYIYAIGSNGGSHRGTGFMIGPNVVVRSLGKITESSSNFLHSDNIFASQGESGGPCYIRLDGNNTIIGLIQGGNNDVTRFVRIDEPLFKAFAQYNPSYTG